MRILVVSDIHGNSTALKEVISHVSFDYLWVLGDLVDYGPDPGGVVDLVRELDPSVIVRGNHDHAAAFNVDCGCGPSTHELSVLTRSKITLQSLSRNDLDWLKRIPLTGNAELCGSKIHMVHGSPDNPLYGYLYYHKGPAILDMSLERLQSPEAGGSILLHGHTHYQGLIHYRDLLLVNPGSVGQPRDGDNRAAYLVIDVNTDEARFVLGRIKYDVDKSLKMYERSGLPEWATKQLARILRNGKVD
ncbi:MAG: metallophosphatase family protein [Desulfurococcales archaeon]|nr:metallophosphatase family protein [Desulfurococcales archaeon]